MRDFVVILNGYSSRDSLVVVIVEFLEGDGQWHLLDGATVARLESGAYEVAVAGLAEMWLASPDRFDGMRLRLDGREAKAIGAARRGDNVLVLRALIEAPRL